MRYQILLMAIIPSLALGQSVETNVWFTNSNDAKAFHEKITKFKSAFNTASVKQAIEANSHLTAKHLNVDISLFDERFFGAFELRSPPLATEAQYVNKWRSTRDMTNSILFFFSKSGSAYTFKRMVASRKLEDEYLLPLVVEFLNETLTGEVDEVISQASKYLPKVLRPVWNDDKMNRAEALIYNNPKYNARHTNFFHGWFKFGFFNFKPATKDQTKNMMLVNAWSSPTLKDKNWYFSDKYIFTADNFVSSFDRSKIYNWDISFERDNVAGVYIFKDAFLYSMLNYIEGTGKHSPTDVASTWPWAYDKEHQPSRFVSDFSRFRARDSTDRLILYFDESLNENEGQEISKLSASSQNTWCNIFACDLANEILFGNIFGDVHNGPWGANNCASALHQRIYYDDKNFKEVPLEKAWEYAMKGYVVYLTMFNKNMDPNAILNPRAEGELCGPKSGHIATCFPRIGAVDGLGKGDPFKRNYVIQAGEETGVRIYSECIGEKYDDKVLAHIYLGYLK